MSKSKVEVDTTPARQDAYRAALGRLSRDAGGADTPRRSDAAVFQDLAAAGEFTPAELREEIDGLGLLPMSHADPARFAAIAAEVGAEVAGMDGPGAVGAVVRAIMSGVKPRARKEPPQ